MIKHVLSLFRYPHRWKTISYLLISSLLIIASQIIGITDNLPGIVLLISGMIFFFFAMFHPWKKSKNYAILIGVLFCIILLTLLSIYILSALHKTEYISEGIVMSIIGLICFPGILMGIIGVVFWSIKGK